MFTCNETSAGAMSSGGACSSYFSSARERRRKVDNSVIGWLAEVRYLDGALVAPPACADTSEPRDEIDNGCCDGQMFFAMSPSIWLQHFDFLVSGARQIRPLSAAHVVLKCVEHGTTALARLSSGSRLECGAPASIPPPTPRAPALAQLPPTV
jgi:hypothetical protein